MLLVLGARSARMQTARMIAAQTIVATPTQVLASRATFPHQPEAQARAALAGASGWCRFAAESPVETISRRIGVPKDVLVEQPGRGHDRKARVPAGLAKAFLLEQVQLV